MALSGGRHRGGSGAGNERMLCCCGGGEQPGMPFSFFLGGGVDGREIREAVVPRKGRELWGVVAGEREGRGAGPVSGAGWQMVIK